MTDGHGYRGLLCPIMLQRNLMRFSLVVLGMTVCTATVAPAQDRDQKPAPAIAVANQDPRLDLQNSKDSQGDVFDQVGSPKKVPYRKPPLSTKQVVERASRALVLITTRSEHGEDIARGSGFFIDQNVVATNLHVLKWASKATAKLLSDGVEYPVKEVLGSDLNNVAIFAFSWPKVATERQTSALSETA